MASQAQDHQHSEFIPMFSQQSTQTQASSDSAPSSVFPYTPQQPFNTTTLSPSSNNLLLDMELVNSFLSMQGFDSHPQSPMVTSPIPNQMLLEQQLKLSQLQQLQALQTQILQQQMRLLSDGQQNSVLPSSLSDNQMDTNARGVQTPGLISSTEMRPQQSMDFLSPINLHYNQGQDRRNSHFNILGESSYADNMPSQPQYLPDRSCTSAPAHIAFRPPVPMAPADLDFDISPLTSPWLGAEQPTMPSQHSTRRYSTNKRPASPSGESSSRKKQSPAIGPSDPSVFALTPRTRASRDSKSVSSTPLLRSSSKRGAFTHLPKNTMSMGEPPGDSPSPVDLSMPPPAQPTNIGSSSASSSSTSSDNFPPISPALDPHLMPVTPASIMNLGRLGLNNAVPPTHQANTSSVKIDTTTTKGRPRASSKAGAEGNTRAKSLKKAPATTKAAPAVSAAPVEQVRKTSHKAAEQKRRDSLKTTFDDLRGLLPPIPLPSDENFGDERVLPGALPPRGPPKAGGEGPNKGVSKLQLLMCGNEFIRQLKDRVDRRDEEIEKLRREIKRLRLLFSDEAAAACEDLDLTRDLDAIESQCNWPCNGSGKVSLVEEDDEGEVD